jgi:hypothetical protein
MVRFVVQSATSLALLATLALGSPAGAAPLPPCETVIPNTVFFNLSDTGACGLPPGAMGTGVVVLSEDGGTDLVSWSDVLIFSVVGGQNAVEVLSDGEGAFPTSRNDPRLVGAITFIRESATQPSTPYTPLTGLAPGGFIDNTGPVPITQTPIYNVFSDPTNEVPEPSTLALFGVGLLCLGAALRRTRG